MKTRNGLTCVLVACAGLAMTGWSEPVPAPTPTPTPTPASPSRGVPAAIADAAFLGGCWQGKMGKNKDNHVEEVWSNPSGNNLIGMFRWLKADGTPMVFELLTVSEEEGTLALRLRHQNADGSSWEDKDKPLVFRLSEKGDNLLHFEAFKDCGDLASCRYEIKEGTLHIAVAFNAPSEEDQTNGQRQRPALQFELTKSPL